MAAVDSSDQPLKTRFRHVERDCGFSSIHSSRSCKSETGCVGERRAAAATGVFKRNVPQPKVNNRDRLFWIGLYMIWQDWKIRADDCASGNRNLLALQVGQTVVVEVRPNLNNLAFRGLIGPPVAPLPATALTVCCRVS